MTEVTHIVTLYRATMNSAGVRPEQYEVQGDDILRQVDSGGRYCPPAKLSEIGPNGNDWRTRGLFAKRADAIAAYRAVEQQRLTLAQTQLQEWTV